MFKLHVILFIAFLPLISSLNYAWNGTGHVVVAQIAYDQLYPENKIKADYLTGIIFNELPISLQKKLNVKYANASTFAKVAVLPDVWGQWDLFNVFLTFRAIPPINLLILLTEKTSNWHYIDVPYPDTKHCYLHDDKNVVWAINNLKDAYFLSLGDASKSLMLIFIEHYIADIHQPLHTITNVINSCAGDRGGNDYCLDVNNRNKCMKNLHALWDNALGYLPSYGDIQKRALQLEYLYPVTQFYKELSIYAIDKWAKESKENIEFIYSTPQYKEPDKTYYEYGEPLAKKKLALAGYRLGKVLNEIL